MSETGKPARDWQAHYEQAPNGDRIPAIVDFVQTPPKSFTVTRDQLVDAIACLTVKVRTSGPAAGMINAESMADAIIEALGAPARPVHWQWPPSCMSELVRRDTWTTVRDRVTCPACASSEPGEGSPS